jgi:xylose dehydrogenase (NAD/NADP)
MMGEPVRWGLLGTGEINLKLLAGARRSSAVEVSAVASRTQERADAFAREQGIPRAHGEYASLLADRDIEAIYIALPNALHHPWTMRALAAGKHVLCEKPYSARPDEVVEAFDAAEAAGLVLSEAFMWRHHPQAERLRAVLPELGALQIVRAFFGFVVDRPNDIRLSAELAGGSLMDLGCYCISGSRFVTGEEPDLVFGLAVPARSGVDERFTGILRFPSGVVADFTSAFTTDRRGLEAIGSEGSALLTDPWQSRPAVLVRDGRETRFEAADPYHLELENLGAAIRGEAPPLLGRDDALGQARVIEALRRSVATGAPVRL